MNSTLIETTATMATAEPMEVALSKKTSAVTTASDYQALATWFKDSDISDKKLFNIGRDASKALWFKYLELFPSDSKQFHRCDCCRDFIVNYGGLCYISDDGTAKSAFWNEGVVNPLYAPIVKQMASYVESSKIPNVANSILASSFISTPLLAHDTRLGFKEKGETIEGSGVYWNHLYVDLPEGYKTVEVDDVGNVKRAMLNNVYMTKHMLDQWEIPLVNRLKTLLETKEIPGGDKFLKKIEDLLAVYNKTKDIKNQRSKANLIIREASHNFGMGSLKNSPIGTFVEDVKNGKSWNAALAAYKEQVDPTKYMRSTAEVDDNQISVANKLIDDLGVRDSLERRFLTMEECTDFIWKKPPQHTVETNAASKGAFDKLRKGANDVVEKEMLSSVRMTWTRFAEEVLPLATRIKVNVPTSSGFFAYLHTAVHPEAPYIFKHGRVKNTHVSHSVLHGGWGHGHVRAADIYKSAGESPYGYCDVKIITTAPTYVQGDDTTGMRVFIQTSGKRYLRNVPSGLFPELLINELHGSRAVIDQYSNNTPLTIPEEGDLMIGMLFNDGDWPNVELLIETETYSRVCVIDRFR